MIRLGLLALLVAGALAAAGAAAADGDPASDVLYLENLYLPYPPPSHDSTRELKHAVANVYALRLRVKVAVIATVPDLGSVPELFGRPEQYAKFLGAELQSFYIGPLLVAMPAGFGIYDGGRSTAAEQRVLDATTDRASGPDRLAHLTATVVRRLVAARALHSKDVTKPRVFALPAKGRRGSFAQLRYVVSDDSERARVAIRIDTRSGRKVGNASKPIHSVGAQRIETKRWRVPGHPGTLRLRFCVVAFDDAGNRSPPACAPLLLR